MRKKTKAAILAAAVLVGGNFASAVDRTWINTTSGFYDITSNWSPAGVPTSADNIFFNQPGVTFNVVSFDTITGNRTVNALSVLAGAPIIRAQSDVPLRLTSLGTASFTGSSLTIVDTNFALTNRRMELEAPTVHVSNGSTLQFSQASLIATSVQVGQNGNGTLQFFNRAAGTIQNFNIAAAGNSTSSVQISNASQVNVSSSVFVGAETDTTADLFVTFDGDLVANNLLVGFGIRSTGRLFAEGPGSTLTLSNLSIGTANSDSGLADLRNGASANVSGSTSVGPGGVLDLRGASLTTGNLLNSGLIRIEGATLSVNTVGTSSAGQPVGTFDFRSGTVRFTGGSVTNDEVTGIGALFDGPQILTAGKRIEAGNIGGTFNVSQPFILDGGTLQAGSIFNQQNLELRSGRLEIAGANVNFSTGFGLGTFRDLLPGVSVIGVDTSNVNIGGGSTVIVRDGALLEGSQISNSGTLVLDGPGARVRARLITAFNDFVNSGTIRGSGIIDSTLQNTGVIELRETGPLTVTNSISNQATGRIQGRGSLNAPFLANVGRVELSAGFSDINATVINNAGGRIIVSGGGVASFYRDVTNSAGAEIRTSAGGRTVFFAPVNGSGTFTGTGVVQFENTYSPGSSPGLIAFGGDVELTDASTLNIELAGPTRGTQYDALDIAGSVDIRGDLVLSILGGYVPDYGVPHTFINATSRSGIFATVTGVQLSATKFLAVTYNASADVVVTAALPGDTNVDGTVNFADLLALARNFGAIGRSWADGDFGGNGSVQFDDLLALARNFGSTLVLGEIVIDANASFDSDWRVAQSVVPEPTALAGLAALSLLAARRRR